MSLHELYQEMIVDHSRSPRNFHKLQEKAQNLEGYNPLCGDKFTIYASFKGKKISDLSFEGNGCAISTASASLMTEFMKNKSFDEAESIIAEFQRLVTGGELKGVDLGKLQVFEGVQEFPIRVKCAVLAWHTLRSLLHGERKAVTTE
ncbi:MAG: SUF system NifU family Fe-S cluster assembly protein [Deltaproteobacteria bacterium]|nr:SUF system NifU family Fe-S cluster assembly protein [Deltaproteobacteria bacterium]